MFWPLFRYIGGVNEGLLYMLRWCLLLTLPLLRYISGVNKGCVETMSIPLTILYVSLRKHFSDRKHQD